MSEVPDDEAAAFAARLRNACHGDNAAARIAAASGMSVHSIRKVAYGHIRPGRTMISRVTPVLGEAPPAPSGQPTPSHDDSVIRFAISKAIENDAECIRLREQLATAEARVRKAVAELLGGAS